MTWSLVVEGYTVAVVLYQSIAYLFLEVICRFQELLLHMNHIAPLLLHLHRANPAFSFGYYRRLASALFADTYVLLAILPQS